MPNCDILECELEDLQFLMKKQLANYTEELGISVISPDEIRHGIHFDRRINRHAYLALLLLKKMFRIGSPEELCDKNMLETLNKRFNIKDFITIHHIYREDSKEAFIFVPAVITLFEYRELQKLRPLLEKDDVSVIFLIDNIDPRTGLEYDTEEYGFNGKSGKADVIDTCLKYLLEHGRVEDYTLPYEKEKSIG